MLALLLVNIEWPGAGVAGGDDGGDEASDYGGGDCGGGAGGGEGPGEAVRFKTREDTGVDDDVGVVAEVEDESSCKHEVHGLDGNGAVSGEVAVGAKFLGAWVRGNSSE